MESNFRLRAEPTVPQHCELSVHLPPDPLSVSLPESSEDRRVELGFLAARRRRTGVRGVDFLVTCGNLRTIALWS